MAQISSGARAHKVSGARVADTGEEEGDGDGAAGEQWAEWRAARSQSHYNYNTISLFINIPTFVVYSISLFYMLNGN
jgi:hypothetical protein